MTEGQVDERNTSARTGAWMESDRVDEKQGEWRYQYDGFGECNGLTNGVETLPCGDGDSDGRLLDYLNAATASQSQVAELEAELVDLDRAETAEAQVVELTRMLAACDESYTVARQAHDLRTVEKLTLQHQVDKLTEALREAKMYLQGVRVNPATSEFVKAELQLWESKANRALLGQGGGAQ